MKLESFCWQNVRRGYAVKQRLFSAIEGSPDVTGGIICGKFELILLFKWIACCKLEGNIASLER